MTLSHFPPGTLTTYRITQKKHLSTAFDGEGARLNGGRWNSIGTRMIYTASSLSLATLELLVHTEDISTIYGLYAVIPIEFDSTLVQDVDVDSLPHEWDSPEPISDTQIIGDQWISSMSSVLLEIPSAVNPREMNYLINPAHSDFSQIVLGSSFEFEPDQRL